MSAKPSEEPGSEGRWFGEDLDQPDRCGGTVPRFGGAGGDPGVDQKQEIWKDDASEQKQPQQPDGSRQQPLVAMETASTGGNSSVFGKLTAQVNKPCQLQEQPGHVPVWSAPTLRSAAGEGRQPLVSYSPSAVAGDGRGDRKKPGLDLAVVSRGRGGTRPLGRSVSGLWRVDAGKGERLCGYGDPIDLLRKSVGGDGDLYTTLLSNQSYSFQQDTSYFSGDLRQGDKAEVKQSNKPGEPGEPRDRIPSFESQGLFSSDSGIEMTPGESIDVAKNLMDSEKMGAYNYMDIRSSEAPQTQQRQQHAALLQDSWTEKSASGMDVTPHVLTNLGDYSEKSPPVTVETLGPALDKHPCPFVEDPSDEELSDYQSSWAPGTPQAASPVKITLTQSAAPPPPLSPQVTVSERESILSLGLEGVPTVTLSEPEDDSPGSSTPPLTEESESLSEVSFQASVGKPVSALESQPQGAATATATATAPQPWATPSDEPEPPKPPASPPLPSVQDHEASSAESGDSEIELVSEEPPAPAELPGSGYMSFGLMGGPPPSPASPSIQYSILREEREAELDSELIIESCDASSASEESPKREQDSPALRARGPAESRLADSPSRHTDTLAPSAGPQPGPPRDKQAGDKNKGFTHPEDSAAARAKSKPPAGLLAPEGQVEHPVPDEKGPRKTSQSRAGEDQRESVTELGPPLAYMEVACHSRGAGVFHPGTDGGGSVVCLGTPAAQSQEANKSCYTLQVLAIRTVHQALCSGVSHSTSAPRICLDLSSHPCSCGLLTEGFTGHEQHSERRSGEEAVSGSSPCSSMQASPDSTKMECLWSSWKGKAIDLLYWRDLKQTGIVFGSVLLLLFSLTQFSVVSVIAYLALAALSATISFRIYKSVLQAVQKTDEGHPFKAYLDVEISLSQDQIQKYADNAQAYVNSTLKELRRLFLVQDLVDSLKFAVLMWLLTYVGALFNGLTLLIMVVVSMFTMPVVYEKYQAQIDQYLGLVRTHVNSVVAKHEQAAVHTGPSLSPFCSPQDSSENPRSQEEGGVEAQAGDESREEERAGRGVDEEPTRYWPVAVPHMPLNPAFKTVSTLTAVQLIKHNPNQNTDFTHPAGD
ncbi:RTN1A protein, partial [Atractosteus spatula]|nr:RTN1A protein [Atractosteus spatula]